MNIIQALEAFGRSTGDYWAQDNAAFEKTHPSLPARFVRAVNPMTGFGSALGAMHDAAGAGFPAKDTAIALMQSVPSFGSVIARKGLTGLEPAVNYLKTLGAFGAGTTASVAAEVAQAMEQKK